MSFQSYLHNIETKTGRSPAELHTEARQKGLADEAGLAPGMKAGAVIA